jgi:hypothetical protein
MMRPLFKEEKHVFSIQPNFQIAVSSNILDSEQDLDFPIGYLESGKVST